MVPCIVLNNPDIHIYFPGMEFQPVTFWSLVTVTFLARYFKIESARAPEATHPAMGSLMLWVTAQGTLPDGREACIHPCSFM